MSHVIFVEFFSFLSFFFKLLIQTHPTTAHCNLFLKNKKRIIALFDPGALLIFAPPLA